MSDWKRAFALSKEEIEAATPPGTVTLIEHADKLETVETGQSHDDQGQHQVLYPTPSTDPCDPLNWAPWRKMALLAVASLYAFMSNFAASNIATGLQLWPTVYPRDPQPFARLSYLVSVTVLMAGASNMWWVPLSNLLGRRPVLLVATLTMTLSTMWCGLAGSFNSILAGRMFVGIGAGAAETVAPMLIGEVFFVHQRGRAMAIYTIFLATGSVIGALAGGYIAFRLGWAYIFWVTTAISAVCFLGVVLVVPETLYDQNDGRQARPFTLARSLGFVRPRRRSLAEGLALFLQPWRTLALPGTWVVTLHYGAFVGGAVAISIVGPQLLASPPYLWSAADAGLVNVGAIVGALLGALYTFVTADARLARRQTVGRGTSTAGLTEPEDRLPAMFPGLFLATTGFWVFGFCARYPSERGWVGLEVGYGMILFGLMQVPSIGFNYLIDAYGHLALDCFVIVTVLRGIVSFVWTIFVAAWVAKDGAAEPFGIFGMLMGLFALLTVPLWLWGKRMRVATAGTLERGG